MSAMTVWRFAPVTLTCLCSEITPISSLRIGAGNPKGASQVAHWRLKIVTIKTDRAWSSNPSGSDEI
jgi:hypothetical protein